MSISGADVIVVGAGVVGASVAFHLEQIGAHVLVLDRRGIAAGATGASAGFVRVYHQEPALTRIADASWPEIAGWEDIIGGPIHFEQTGCVQELPPSSDTASIEALARALETDWEIVRAPDLRRLFPGMWWPEETLAVYEPSAGYASPRCCAEQYLRRVVDLGGSVWTGVVALKLLVEAGRVVGVVTSSGSLSADAVIIALGSWSGSSSFVDLPVSLRAKRIVTQRVVLPREIADLPAYIDEGAHSLFFRPNGPFELLVGGGEGAWEEHPGTLPREASEAHLREMHRRVEPRIGVRVACVDVISGLDAYTPDALPIVDRYPRVDGAYVATGFSGAGFKVAPAVGRLLADWTVEGTKDELLEPFRLTRFSTPAGAAEQPDCTGAGDGIGTE